MRRSQFIIMAAIPFVIGCTKGSSSDTSGVHEAKINQAVSNWCRIDKIDSSLQIISRYRTEEGKLSNLTFIRVGDGSVPVSYRYPAFTTGAFFAPTLSPISSNNVQSTPDFEQQSLLYEDFIKANPNLNTARSDFSADAFVEIKENGLFSDSTSFAYPCSAYSNALNTDGPIRPMVELSVYLGQTVSAELFADSAIAFPALQLPVEPVKFSSLGRSVSAWCSWAGSTLEQASVEVLVVGQDKVIEAFASGYIASSATEEAANLKADLDLSKTYKILQNSEILSFDYKLESLGPATSMPETFQLVRDAQGESALLSVNPDNNYAPPLIANATNLFSDCSDRRPLARYPQMSSKLKMLIEGMKQKF